MVLYTQAYAESVIITAFNRLFNRDPLPEGLAYWSAYLVQRGTYIPRAELDAMLLAGAGINSGTSTNTATAATTTSNTSSTAVATRTSYYSTAGATKLVTNAFNTLFGRDPAKAGLDYWVAYLLTLKTKIETEDFYKMLLNGASVADLAYYNASIAEEEDPITPPAVTGYYTQATAEKLVITEFNKLFGRDPAAEGLAYWSAYLRGLKTAVNLAKFEQTLLNGASAADRAYYNSVHEPEAPPVSEGGYYTRAQAEAIVTQTFLKLFGRVPAAAGLDYWADYLMSLDDEIEPSVFEAMLLAGASEEDRTIWEETQSPEVIPDPIRFYSQYSADLIIKAAFNRLFGRDPLPAGLEYWTEFLMGLTSAIDLEVLDAMLLAGASAEDLAYYNAHLPEPGEEYPDYGAYYSQRAAEAIVIQAFNDLFGRDPLPAGLEYWTRYLLTLDHPVDMEEFRAMLLRGAVNPLNAAKTPQEYLKMFTVADTTFIVNSTVTAKMLGRSGNPGWQCCLYLSAAKYGKTYKVIVDGTTVASVQTPSVVTIDPTIETDKTTGLQASEVMLQIAEGEGASVNIDDNQITVRQISGMWRVSKNAVSMEDKGSFISFSNGMPGTPTTRYVLHDLQNIYLGEGKFDENDYYLFAYNSTDTELVRPAGYEGMTAVVTMHGEEQSSAVQGSVREWALANDVTMQTSQDGTVIVLQSDDKYSVEVSDGDNGDSLRVIGTTYDTYDKLPSICVHGYKVKILGKDGDSANDYYVQFERTDESTGIGRGVWRECVGFDEMITFDASTMPHKLVSEADGTFTLSEIEWGVKEAGDEDSNPTPSFIGNKITDMGLYQNRLVFLSDENCIASRAYDHYDLFSASVIQESDDDPIDTASSDNQITTLQHLIIFNACLMIVSDKAQFLHPADKEFTPNTFSLASKAHFTADTVAAPVASATSAYFPYKYGEFSGVRELKFQEITNSVQADSITMHVKEYIPGSITQIVASIDHDVVLVRSDGAPYSIFVYEWFDQDDTRKQAAWHEWEFPTPILYISAIKDILYIWYMEDTAVRFCTLDLSDRDSLEVDFPIRLDYMEMIQASDSGDYWELEKDISTVQGTWDDVVVVGGKNSGIEGAAATWSPNDSDTGLLIPKLAVPNPNGVPWFYVGRRFDTTLTITTPFVRSNDGTPKTTGRTTFKFMKFNFANTGYVQIDVAKKFAPTYSTEWSSKVVGSSEYLLNSAAPLQDVSIRVPVRGSSDDCTISIRSDSHLPFHILDVDWACNYNEKGRRTL